LRERYGVTLYPTILILDASGAKLGMVDLTQPRPRDSYRARVIAALHEAHQVLGLKSVLMLSPINEAAKGLSSRPDTPGASAAVSAGLRSAIRHILTAFGTAAAIVFVLLWLIRRDWSSPLPRNRPPTIADRIADASNGLPTYEEIIAWPKERVVGIATGLAESQGFATEPQRDHTSDIDIVLKRSKTGEKQGLICCAGGNAGVITVKRVRELFGMITIEGLPHAWFVAPMGFAAEARAYADQHNVRLIDGHGLLASLRDLPPVSVPSVVTREPWPRAS
jgi:hypothetical protein